MRLHFRYKINSSREKIRHVWLIQSCSWKLRNFFELIFVKRFSERLSQNFADESEVISFIVNEKCRGWPASHDDYMGSISRDSANFRWNALSKSQRSAQLNSHPVFCCFSVFRRHRCVCYTHIADHWLMTLKQTNGISWRVHGGCNILRGRGLSFSFKLTWLFSVV